MKTLLIFTLYLISGQVDCVGMTGYAGGSVFINCQYDYKYTNHTKYFCKLHGKECFQDKTLSNTGDYVERVFSVDGNERGLYSVLIKNLSKQDDGTYRCGVSDKTATPTDITLKVKEDPCCGTTLARRTHPGETVTFTCTYPEEYKYLAKYVYKATGHRIHVVLLALGLSVQNETLSLSDQPKENLFNVSFRDVTEEDGGVYLCGVQGKKDHYPNYFLFNEIQLEVTGLQTATGFTGIIIIIIIVCVCVVLLLIGLICKLRRNRAEGSPNTLTGISSTTNEDSERDPPGNQNVASLGPLYQNQNSSVNQSNSDYQNQNRNIHQLVYQSLNPNTIQSDSVYHTLNSNTNQSDLDYQNQNPNINQSVYQSLNPNTIQSDSVYQSLNPNTNQSDSVYHSLNLNTNQSDLTYQNQNPKINESTRV